MTDKFDLQAKKSRLLAEMKEKIEKVRLEYQDKIQPIIDELDRIPLPPRKPSAIERYTEAEDAPTRYCEYCKEPMLRATVENAKLILKNNPELSQEREIHYGALRRMQKPYCCHCCKEGKGDGSHSNWCSSVTTQEYRTAPQEVEQETE